MCLAIPLKVVNIVDENTIVVKSGDHSIDVSGVLIGKVNVGEYVMVHAGFAIQKMSEKEAKDILSYVPGEQNA